MNKSDNIQELCAALVKFQSEVRAVKKDSENPYFKSKYADLSSIWETIRKPLSANGLAVIQTNQADMENGVILETILLHSSGQWISGVVKMTPTKNDPQGFGSCQTYARRYGLSAILGIATEDDDDGNAASEPKKEKTNEEKYGNNERSRDKDPNHYWTFKSKKDKDKYGIGAIEGDKLNRETLEAFGFKEYPVNSKTWFADYNEELLKELKALGGIFNNWGK